MLFSSPLPRPRESGDPVLQSTTERWIPASRERGEFAAIGDDLDAAHACDFVAERAARDAEALVTPTARLSYADQHRAVRRAAKAMHALGVRQGDFVGILLGNTETWVTLFYAAATIGAVTVPINTRFKSAELAFCLKQADVKVLFTADRFLNIDFLAFLREAEPAIDRALPGTALPLLRARRRHRRRNSASSAQLRRFSRARRWRNRRRARRAAPPRLRRTTCCSSSSPPARQLIPRPSCSRTTTCCATPGRSGCGSASAPTTAISTAGRSSTSPARRCRCWCRSPPARAW